MLRKESENIVNYYSQRKLCVNSKMEELSNDCSKYSRGALGMLKKLACTNKTYQNQAERMHRSLCQDHTDVPPDIDLSSDSSDGESDAFILS